MSPTEIVPLLVVVLLLLTASGVEPDRMDVVFDGDHEQTTIDDALVVGGGTVTIPASATASGELFVVGGRARIDGHLDGNVTVLAGNLTVADGARITGELRTIGGSTSVAPGATVGSRTTLDVTPRRSSPAETAGFLALQVLVVGSLAGVLARRWPDLPATVGDAITHHTVVSGVVGSLAGAASLVLLVYMAFTIVLLPVSIVGLVAGFSLVVYGYLVYGFLLGRLLPIERTDLSAAVGAGLFVVVIEVLGRIPIAGALAQFGLVAVALGAVLITYLGLQRFEPADIPG